MFDLLTCYSLVTGGAVPLRETAKKKRRGEATIGYYSQQLRPSPTAKLLPWQHVSMASKTTTFLPIFFFFFFFLFFFSFLSTRSIVLWAGVTSSLQERFSCRGQTAHRFLRNCFDSTPIRLKTLTRRAAAVHAKTLRQWHLRKPPSPSISPPVPKRRGERGREGKGTWLKRRWSFGEYRKNDIHRYLWP